ncbi:MAG: cytochrome P450 [Polyangiaceae bacterium]|nr:cytochrome P450 [Polyangiaceae bacterium]
MTMSAVPMGQSAQHKSFPGPRGRPLVGNLLEAWNDPLDLFGSGTLRHGDLVRFRFAWIDYYLLNDAAAAHRVLVENAKGYHKSPNYKGLKIMLGQGLLTSEGDYWKRQRKLAQPAFHRESLRTFAREMVDATSDMMARWRADDAVKTAPFDLHQEMMRLTFRIVGKTLLGADLEADAREFGESLNVALKWANEYVESVVRVPPWVPTPNNRRFSRAQRSIEGVVRRVVEERRKSGEKKNDLLGMLMSARDEQTGETMSDRQLMDELLTLTLAGHETTANALSFTFYLLSRHPSVARRARAEIASVLGTRDPGLEDLGSMPFTKALIEESMRLYPPAWVVERYSLEEDEVLGHHIPKNAIVAVSPFAMHRNPRYFENPEGFDPDRFLTADPNRPKLAYMPFGAGPRTCIGNAFAMMEMQLIVPMLLRAFQLDLVSAFKLELDPSVTLRPKAGIWVRFGDLPKRSN